MRHRTHSVFLATYNSSLVAWTFIKSDYRKHSVSHIFGKKLRLYMLNLTFPQQIHGISPHPINQPRLSIAPVITKNLIAVLFQIMWECSISGFHASIMQVFPFNNDRYWRAVLLGKNALKSAVSQNTFQTDGSPVQGWKENQAINQNEAGSNCFLLISFTFTDCNALHLTTAAVRTCIAVRLWTWFSDFRFNLLVELWIFGL